MQAGNSVTTTLIERIAKEIKKVLWNHSQKLILKTKEIT
jgi:site-specific DNA-cytosine methylase